MQALRLVLALVPVVTPAPAQDSDPAQRLTGARGLAPDTVLLLRGHLVNHALRDPVRLRFDAAGRLHADYGGTILFDMAFDGERAWTVDSAGRTYEIEGMQRDFQLAFHGLLCGNLLAGQRWDLQPAGEGRLRPSLVDRHLELGLELDPTGLPRRVDVVMFGRDQSLNFSDWRTSDWGRWPRRVEFRDGPRLVATFEFDGLGPAEETAFGPPVDPGFAVAFDREADPEIPARRVASGHMFVRASIDGEDVGWFSFDTGAGRSLVDSRVARRLELETLTDGLRSTGAGGATRISIHRADHLVLGPLRWESPVFAAADLSGLEKAFGVSPYGGLLGADLLAHAVWKYDIENRRVTAHPAGHQPEGVSWVPVTIREGQLVAPLGFEGHEGRFVVDTGGGSALYFNGPTVQRLGLLEGRETRSTKVRGVGGLVTVQQGPMVDVSLGTRTFDRLRATFTSTEAEGSWSDPYVDGIAGIAFLRSAPVWLDYPARRIGLEAEP